jgi:hypothetical protein
MKGKYWENTIQMAAFKTPVETEKANELQEPQVGESSCCCCFASRPLSVNTSSLRREIEILGVEVAVELVGVCETMPERSRLSSDSDPSLLLPLTVEEARKAGGEASAVLRGWRWRFSNSDSSAVHMLIIKCVVSVLCRFGNGCEEAKSKSTREIPASDLVGIKNGLWGMKMRNGSVL